PSNPVPVRTVRIREPARSGAPETWTPSNPVPVRTVRIREPARSGAPEAWTPSSPVRVRTARLRPIEDKEPHPGTLQRGQQAAGMPAQPAMADSPVPRSVPDRTRVASVPATTKPEPPQFFTYIPVPKEVVSEILDMQQA